MSIDPVRGVTVAVVLAATFHAAPTFPAPTPRPGASAKAEAEEPPVGLTRDDWSQIRRAVQQSDYHASRVGNPGDAPALQAPNRRQAYRTTFRREGIEIVPQTRTASWRLGLAVVGYGYEGDVRPVKTAEPRARKERVEYRRGLVTEWYVNRPGGLEQGFDLEQPQPRRAGPLVVAMAVEGDLDASLSNDGVSFSYPTGDPLVRYARLEAWDADGRPLRSRLEAEDREIRLVVEVEAARFPVTVDPTFIHEAQLFGRRDPFGQEDAEFGFSVSVSGDTAVVGAYLDNTPGAENAGSAYVFVRSGTTWTEQQRLVASDGALDDQFGRSVSISGDTVVVGAYVDDTAGGQDAGSAYVFARSGTTWTEQQKLLASDGEAGDEFGSSVSVSGDTVVVGANFDDTPGGANAGSAYVFVRSGTTWTEQQKLLAPDGAADDHFGWSLSVSGDTAVIGAFLDDTPGGVDAGSAYVFVRSGTTWTEQQKLLASDGAPDDHFGFSVSTSGDTAVVGAVFDDTPDGANAGSAYVFERSGTTWTEQQHLRASDGATGDLFGFSGSVSGDTVVVGASFDDTPVGAEAGSAYVFVRSGTTWTEQQKLLASDGAANDLFGNSVSVSGDTVVVGAYLNDTPDNVDAGAAYVFVRSGTTWTEQQKLLVSDGALEDLFGISVSISGDTAVVGAHFDDTVDGGADAGSAYVFVRTGTTWTVHQKLLASDGAAGDNFGFSVSVSGDTAVVGAPFDDTPGGVDAGSAYVFVRVATIWTQQQKVLASDGAAGDNFGISGSVSGDTAVVGAYLDTNAGGFGAGSAYVFIRSGTTWSQQQKLLASNGEDADFFGVSVSISGNTVVVGAYFTDIPPSVNDGSAYVFVRSGTTWSQQQELVASDAVFNDLFGISVSVSGETLVVGALFADTPGGTDAGASYVFVRSGTTWSEQQKLLASDGADEDLFGMSVSVSGDTVVVGANNDDTPGGLNAGSAYVFARSGTTWSQQQKLLAPDGAEGDQFGSSVSVSGDTTVVGAPFDDTSGGTDAGSAHVFRERTIADVAISITDSPDPVPLGANLVYAIIVTNSGPDAAPSVQAALPTPTGLTFVSNQGACTSPFPCALGTVPAGQTRTITATYKVPFDYLGPNPIVAAVTATTTAADPNSANNQATAQTTVAPASADLAIVKLGPAIVTAESDIVYSITVDNVGPSDAAGVQVTDPTPTGLTFVSNAGSCTTPFPCALATVPSGQSRVITATFHVPGGYSGPNPIVNQATVIATTPDPNGANNADDVSTMFIPPNLEPASLVVDGTGNSVFQPNETVTVAPSWRNAGAATLANVAGAASNFTGPVGPTYTIADAAATYGTIAPFATVSCGADCYRMTNAATTRPSPHWDATFLEAVTPGTATRTWTLHIGDSFTDVAPTSGFYRFIETILHKNVTGGCSATAYCPTSSTTREQMAVFVLVAWNPTAPPPAVCVVGSETFADVPATSGFCRWVEELARRGVVSGCGGGNYCPSAPATREQMAIFVLRTLDPALNPPACGTPVFADVPASSPFCRWIEELVRRGVVSGCGGGNYCPTASVTREQMSVFLAVTFSLSLYGL